MSTYFWFIAGMLAGVCAALVAWPLVRGALTVLEHRKTRIAIAATGVVGFCAVAFVLYRTFGSPELLSGSVASTAGPHPGMSAAASGEAPASMDSVVAGLEARIAREGGKREDWLLLAQSYDFLGRTADAQRARDTAERGGTQATQTAQTSSATPAARTAAPAESAPASTASDSTAAYERRVSAKPNDTDAWRALAGLYRREHDYAKARDAFAKLVQLKAMDADAWADYADVLASASKGSLRGEAAKAIDAALRLDPAHAKGLWLKASLAHEEHRYADALAVWRQLRAALPPDSSDVRIVDANIAEAAELAGLPVPKPAGLPAASSAAGFSGASSADLPAASLALLPAANPTASVAGTAAGGAEVSGTVSIDSRLAGRVPAGATLFIYAKAADSPGPPLAVLRQAASTWPVVFRLDDTLAMIPSRKLSQFERVIVEARISRSGQATPAAGDLYVTSAVLKPGEHKKLALVIDHEVG